MLDIIILTFWICLICLPILVIVSNFLTYKMAKQEGIIDSVKDYFLNNMIVSIFFWKVIFGIKPVKNKKLLLIYRIVFYSYLLLLLTLIFIEYEYALSDTW